MTYGEAFIQAQKRIIVGESAGICASEAGGSYKETCGDRRLNWSRNLAGFATIVPSSASGLEDIAIYPLEDQKKIN
jgi:hypothetical protein